MASENQTNTWPMVSVCIPVKNGARRLGRCLQSLKELDYPQDRLEVIIADGRSTDETIEVARSFGANVIDNPAQIVAAGRNVAFGAAAGDIIASTDDDCIVPRDWIKRALAAFEDGVGAVGGISILPKDAPRWARAANYMFRLASRAGYSVQSDHLSEGEAEDLPGCNAFYRVEAYHQAGPFDEGLVTAEDVDLHQRLREQGFRLKASNALFVWHDKRPSPIGLIRQMRRFAEGRVQLARKRPSTIRPLHHLMGWALPLGLVMLGLATAYLPFSWVAILLAGVWTILAIKAVTDREPVIVALLAGAALASIVSGWSIGYLKETFFPMPSTEGR